MDRLIYTSLTAMRSAQARQAATANNLANAQTPGFRGDIAEAQTLWVRGDGLESRAVASEEVVGADMRAGVVMTTGRDLDVAMQGDALLVVQADNGEEAYTRRGDLQLSQSGLLTNGEGQPVMGSQGPITLPPADKIMIDSDGRTVEDFGLTDNLMMIHALDLHGAPLVTPRQVPADLWRDLAAFEACVILAADRAAGRSR